MNVRDNLTNGVYDNKIPYSYEKIPVDENSMTVNQAKAHILAEKEKDRAQRALHRQEDARISMQIKADLELEHGVAGHRNADKLWELAWEHGHSSGYADIICYYENFVQLIQS